ncbi:MAG TPA: hypothetical protein VNF91_00485 [Candidatus Acidoferrum sp.]|nr:hypothetical protein [Candidatus Acidoferrum sp.]
MLSSTYFHGNGDLTLHLVTISKGLAIDRTILDKQHASVLDANQRIALITIDGDTQLATLNLDTAAIRALGVSSPSGFGPGVLSPDGTQAAVLARPVDPMTYEILIVDLGSGAVRHLIQISALAYNRAALDPMRWTANGILVSPGIWDGGRATLLNLDPQNGNLNTITDARFDVLSPSATMMAAAVHANLGDVQYEGQGTWPNRLTAGPIGPPLAAVVEQKNRAFSALDITDDGSILYLADDDPFDTSGGYNKTSPAPDMGIYLAAGGQSIHELGETYVGQWGAGSLVGSGLALVTKVVVGEAGSAEIDLVSLCTTSGCNPKVQIVATISGANPEARLTLLRPVPAT